VVIMSAGDFIIPSTIGLKARIYMMSSLIWQNSSSFPAGPDWPRRRHCCWSVWGWSASSCSGARSRAAPASPGRRQGLGRHVVRARPDALSAGGAGAGVRALLVGLSAARGRLDGVHEVLGALGLRLGNSR
jgi:hypothetical protein